MVFYGVVSARRRKVVEFFLERDAAEAMIGEIRERADDSVLAEGLRVEAISLGSTSWLWLASGLKVGDHQPDRHGDTSHREHFGGHRRQEDFPF